MVRRPRPPGDASRSAGRHRLPCRAHRAGRRGLHRPPRPAGPHPPGGPRARPGARHHRRRLRRHPRNGQPATAHRARHGIRHGSSRAGRRGQGDSRRAVPGRLAPVGSGGAPLGGRAGCGRWARHRGLRPPVENRSGRHRGGCSLPQERLRRRDPPVARPAHHTAAPRTAPGRHGAGARRLGRSVHHSGRVGLASELTAPGASTTETMLAGGRKTARMVAHYSAAATAEQGAVAKYL